MESVKCAVSLCPMQYSDINKMREHLEDYHGFIPNTRAWKCEEVGCDKTYQSCYKFKQHYVQHHKKRYVMNTTQSCNHCNKTLMDGQRVKVHLDTVHEDMKIPTFRQFKCGECGLSYTKPWGLKTHAKEQHNGRVNQILLNFTTQDYANVCNDAIYGLHFQQGKDKVSTGNANECDENTTWLQCDSCPLMATNEIDLDAHRYMGHELGERMYNCDLCNMAFNTKAGLSKHYQKKSLCKAIPRPPTEYKCRKCPSICFSNHGRIWEHIKTKHTLPTKDYNMTHACTTCNVPFMSKRTLDIHQQKFHQDTTDSNKATVKRKPKIIKNSIVATNITNPNETRPTDDGPQSTNSNFSKTTRSSESCENKTNLPNTKEKSNFDQLRLRQITKFDKINKPGAPNQSLELKTSNLSRKRQREKVEKIGESVDHEVTEKKKARNTLITMGSLVAGCIMNGKNETIIESYGNSDETATIHNENNTEMSNCLTLDDTNENDDFLNHECLLCGELFSNSTNYKIHLQTHEATSLQIPKTAYDEALLVDCLLCDLCGKICSNVTDYQEHLLTHQEDSNPLPFNEIDEATLVDCLLCDFCGKICSNVTDYQEHLLTHQEDSNPLPFNEIDEATLVDCLLCDLCGEVVRNYEMHILTHMPKPSLILCSAEMMSVKHGRATTMTYENYNNKFIINRSSTVLKLERVSTHVAKSNNESLTCLTFTKPGIINELSSAPDFRDNLAKHHTIPNLPMNTHSVVAVCSTPVVVSTSQDDLLLKLKSGKQIPPTIMKVATTKNDGAIASNNSQLKEFIASHPSEIQYESRERSTSNPNEHNLENSLELSEDIHTPDTPMTTNTGFVFKRHTVVKSRRD